MEKSVREGISIGTSKSVERVHINDRDYDRGKQKQKQKQIDGIIEIQDEDDDEVYGFGSYSDAEIAYHLQLKETLLFSKQENSTSSHVMKKLKRENEVEDYIYAISSSDDEAGKYTFKISSEPETCNICFETKHPSEMFYGIECTHRFCTPCISMHVQSKVDEKSFPICCPEPQCKQHLGFEQCDAIIPWKTMVRWSEALAESAIPESDKFYCPFKTCSALLLNDNFKESGRSSLNKTQCPCCKRDVCASCKIPWHEGLECSEIKNMAASGKIDNDDLQLLKLAKNKSWKRCPRCNVLIEKNGGCPSMYCTKCRTGFTWGKNLTL